MQNVVKSLQDSSRGGGEYALTNVDLIKSLNGALILLHNQLKYDIKVITDMPGQAVEVIANPQRLTQVWINLIVNAIQAMNCDEPTIWIRIDERMSNTVGVIIRDNGAGINATDQPNIYDKFYTTRYAESGNGVGLHIVKEIIGELNSAISFYSSVRGTEFCVFLPRA
jgi:C4-dicarboxylate-specific signal transduction histidine kinase